MSDITRTRPNADQMDELIRAIKGISGEYYPATAGSIVSAIRSGHADKIPNGSVFKETHAVYGDIYFATRARNQHKVAGDSTRPTITIQPIYLLSSNGGNSAATFQYDRPEAMFAALETAIPSGTVVQFTAAAYDKWTADAFHFTASVDLPVGTMLCLSGYANTLMTSLNVVAYANPKATTALATMAISAGAGDATVNLGAFVTDGNHPQRISYGSNNEEQSNFFQWLNGDSGSNYMDSIWVPKTKYDMMCTSYTSMKGFLGGFSEEFRSYLGLCSIPNLTNNVFESQDSAHAVNTSYTHNGYFFLPSRKEIYGTDENANESGETQFEYYRDIATKDADKLMYAKNAASPTTYWIRTPTAGSAYGVRICGVGSGGGLTTIGANGAHGVAPLAILA